MCKTKAGYLKIGTSRSEDSDSGENVTLKVKWRSFSVDRDYSNSLTSPNIGDFSGSSIPEIIQVQKDWKDRKICPICVLTKRTWNWAISLCCRVVTAKKCTNKVCCTCRVVVLLIICSYCFFDVPVAVAFVASKGPLWYIQRVKKKEKKENKSKREKRKKSERKKRKKNRNVTFYFLCLRSSPVLKVFVHTQPSPPLLPSSYLVKRNVRLFGEFYKLMVGEHVCLKKWVLICVRNCSVCVWS